MGLLVEKVGSNDCAAEIRRALVSPDSGANERRDGLDPVTLGEVYRVCQRIDAQVSRLKEGTEHERERINTNTLAIELLKLQVNALESKGRDWRGWISSGVIGAALAMLPFVFQWLNHR